EHIFHNQVIDSLQYLFNINGVVYKNSKGKGIQVQATNKALAQIFPRLLGSNSYNKRLPLYKNSSIAAVGALFNGDGSFFFDKGKPRLSLGSKSLKMLWEIRQFL